MLEDCGLLPGKEIPIVPVYGKRWFIDGVERFMGHTRLAHDSQRLFNMQVSRIAETSARTGDAKPIFHPEQVVGHEKMWADDNINNFPFLLLNKMTDQNGMPIPSGPVGMTQPTPLAPATAALLQITRSSMDQLLGSGQNPEEIMSNVSGEALSFAAQRLDARAYIFLTNASKGIRRGGQIWLSMARELYVEPGRIMRGVDGQGGQQAVELMKPVMGADGTTTAYSNDLTLAKCDVSVEVGPTAGSQRQALVNTMVKLLGVTRDPQMESLIQAMILMNVEGEGMGDFHEFMRKKLVMMGVGQPTEKDKADMAAAQAAQQNGTVDPNSIFLLASAGKAQADAQKSVASAEELSAKAAWYKAQAYEILSTIPSPITQAQVAADIGFPFSAPRPQAGQAAPPMPLQNGAASAVPVRQPTQPMNQGATGVN